MIDAFEFGVGLFLGLGSVGLSGRRSGGKSGRSESKFNEAPKYRYEYAGGCTL